MLTDGEDLTLKVRSKRIIEKALEDNVKICTIGFGDGVYNLKLANISNITGFQFFFSSDASGLREVFNRLKSELTNDLIDIDNDETLAGRLFANSGFIAGLYYKKMLPLKAGIKTVDEYSSYAYILTNTYFKNYASLYEYKLKTKTLKYMFGYELYSEGTPSDYWIGNERKLMINGVYKKDISASKIYDIIEQK